MEELTVIVIDLNECEWYLKDVLEDSAALIYLN
jgi:hypothetical protein